MPKPKFKDKVCGFGNSHARRPHGQHHRSSAEELKANRASRGAQSRLCHSAQKPILPRVPREGLVKTRKKRFEHDWLSGT